jgi:hypothetical protein
MAFNIRAKQRVFSDALYSTKNSKIIASASVITLGPLAYITYLR